MTSVQFDTLRDARRLKEVGVAKEEVQAELVAEAFGFYVDNLVTKDYLDATLDARFAQQDRRSDARFAQVEGTLRLHSALLAIIAAAVLIPKLSALALR
ncbi:hypothetical protein [Haliea sp.]